MGVYNVGIYGDSTNIYGKYTKTELSAEPFSAMALTYSSAQLSWVEPAGTFFELRIVRSTEGYPDTAEDGAIVYSRTAATTVGEAEVDEGIPGGKFAYYRIWLLTADNLWKIAAETYTLIPREHASIVPNDGTVLLSAQNKLVDVLPRVYSSVAQSPLDEVDQNSDLYAFLGAMSFTLDILLTYAELLLPADNLRSVNPELLALEAAHLGLIPETYISTKHQRRLVREAFYIYQHKGTLESVGTFTESLTGFAPDVTVSQNVLLTTQDSTFDKGVGFWAAGPGCELEAVEPVGGTPSGEKQKYASENTWAGEVTVAVPGAYISIGEASPTTQGVPVSPGTGYALSAYAKAASGTMPVIGYVTWYDQFGDVIRVDPPITYTQDPQVIADSWTAFSFKTKSPGAEIDVSSVTIASNVLTFGFSTPNLFVPGETVIVEGVERIALETVQETSSIAISSNEVTLTFDSSHGFLEDDVITIRGANNSSLFSEHTVTSVTSTELTFDFFSADLDEEDFVANVYKIVTYDGKYQVLAVGANTASVGTSYADLATTVVSGKLIEALPDTTPILTTTAAWSISSGIAYLTFASSHGLSTGDIILIQGLTSLLDFGVHPITVVDSTTVAFAVLNLDGSTPDDVSTTVDTNGFAVKIVPGTGTAFRKARFATFRLVFLSTGIVYSDMVQLTTTTDILPFTESTFPYYHEARAVEIFLNSSKQNYLKNPAFHADGMTAWTKVGGSYELLDRTTSPISLIGYGNVYSFTTETAGASTLTSITGEAPSGKFYSFSFYAKTSTSGATETFGMTLSAADGVLEEVVATKSVVITITDTWQRFSVTVLAPEITNPMGLVANITGVTTGSTVYIDRPQVEGSFKPTDYFDGEYFDAVWEGEQYASTSHFYPDRAIKVTRLKQELPKYIPINQPYLIQWHGGGYAKLER